jgi:hypothetical protein
VTQWWERCVKTRLKKFISKEIAERNADYRHMENHLYNCMYEVLNSDEAPDKKISKLNGFKAKIMRLHANRTDRIILDQASNYKLDDEPSSLFHLIKQK